MKYYIGDIGFKTKKDCLNYTREKIKTIGECIEIPDEEMTFFINLIKNHPEYEHKIGVGIKTFYIKKDKYGNMATYIKKIDDSDDVFSWTYCCQFKKRDNNFYLNRALRHTIVCDILKFKDDNELKCKLCDSTTSTEYHVDHVYPFCHLVDDYCLNKKIPKSFDDVSRLSFEIKFKKDDFIFEKEWLEYHRTNAKLQILCKTCNLKKSKY